MPVPQSTMEDSTQSISWADRMEDLEASKITPGDFPSNIFACWVTFFFTFSDNLPEPVITIEGDKKTVVSYRVDDGRVKKVSLICLKTDS